jgi:hypothetical protein
VGDGVGVAVTDGTGERVGVGVGEELGSAVRPELLHAAASSTHSTGNALTQPTLRAVRGGALVTPRRHG